jgi:hypothetical protein
MAAGGLMRGAVVWAAAALASVGFPCAAGERAELPASSIVKVVKTADGFQLQRGGKPYYIQGACGNKYLDKLARAGANSARTYGAEEADAVLADAQKNGLTVALGYWMLPPRHGFDYLNAKSVGGQLEKVRAFARKYKDHPALLVWGIGNEVEAGVKEGSPLWTAVWRALNDAAREVKQIDPSHPTMVVVAEISPAKVEALNTLCPDADILGVNSYRGLPTMHDRLMKVGWQRPYIVSEYGPDGQWECPQTPWSVPVELNSTQKAEVYAQRYKKSIEPRRAQCLGSYAFRWNAKQEATATWHGMLLESGETLGAADTLAFAWSGAWPANRAPTITSLSFTPNGNQFAPGEAHQAQVVAEDLEKDALTIHWVLLAESRDRKEGGDREKAPPDFSRCLETGQGPTAAFKAPADPGAYRLFVYVYDGKGHAATGNLPFLVKAAK